MDMIGWRAAWGLCLLQLSLAQIGECPQGRRREWPEGSGRIRLPVVAELVLGPGTQGTVCSARLNLVKED